MSRPSDGRRGDEPPHSEASNSGSDYEEILEELEEEQAEERAEEGGEEDMEIDELEVEVTVKEEVEREEGREEGGRAEELRNGGEAAEHGNSREMQLRREVPLSRDDDGITISTGNQQNSSAPVDHSCEKYDAAPVPVGEVEPSGFHSKENNKQMRSRLVRTEVAPRTSPLDMELMERNKRPAIICDFFAKGWCIRGSSCRFLHVKDNPDGNSRKQVEGKHDGHDKGLRDDSSNGNSLAFASSSSSVQNIDPSMPSTDREDPSKYEDRFISSYRDVIRNGLGRSRYDEDYRIYTSLINRGSSIPLRSNLLSDYGPPNGYESTMSSSHLLSHSMNSTLKSHPLPLSSLTSNASPFSAQSFLDSEYRYASLGQIPPLLSRSGREKYSLPSSNNKRRFSPYNWEPSIPFRPSFRIASVLPSLGSQYDPFLDSVEQRKSGDGVFRAAEQQISGQKKGNQVSGCENEHSMSSHNRISEQVVDRDGRTHGRDSFAAETAENSIVDCQNDNAIAEGNSRPSRENPEVDAPNKTNFHRSDHTRFRKDLKDERVRHMVENNMHHSKTADENKESKFLRHFRFVLIDFVKALLRPSWDGGRLTKNAHNLIVKKAVDKVISTLTNEQVPTSKDSIKQYLSLSEAKISKLVEEYVDKYGKPSEAS